MKSSRDRKRNKVAIIQQRKIKKARELKKKALLSLEVLGCKGVETNIVITSDETIQELNRIYRGKDKPTDVLSFAYGEGNFLGEVIISIDTARKQARELGHSLEEEITRLMVHGLVHLMGYDHEAGKEEEKIFHALESKVIDRLKMTCYE